MVTWIEAGKASPLAITLRGAGKPQSLPGYREGAWSVQEEGSQVAALAGAVRLAFGRSFLKGSATRETRRMARHNRERANHKCIMNARPRTMPAWQAL